ncbi:MAG: (d)CMP kinase [Bacteroidales bacterium]
MKKGDIIIAVDGHSSTGKSTLARKIAAKYGLIYVDTGALYRGVTLAALREGVTPVAVGADTSPLREVLDRCSFVFKNTDKNGGSELYLNDENIERDIRSLDVASKVSLFASIPVVREFIDTILRELGKKRGVVMDGRDIGTVVFPDADLKIFMTADPYVRARRRFLECEARGEKANFEEILRNVKERDYLDENRETAPLRRAQDALFLDNSNMTEEDEMLWIEKIIAQRWGSL